MLNPDHLEICDFVYTAWLTSDTWTCLTGNSRYAVLLAQDFFWQTHKDLIIAAVSEWTRLGWEPIEEINAARIKLAYRQHTEAQISEADVLSWILTFGIALVIQFVLGLKRQYTEYSPVEFRLQMRRTAQNRLQLTAASTLTAAAN